MADSAPGSAAEAIARLDGVLDRMPQTDLLKRCRIDSLKRRCDAAPSPASRFKALEDLSGEYRAYSMDTLLFIARECVRQAYLAHDDSLLYSAYIMQAEGYKGVGDYAGALASLECIPPRWREKFHRRILNRYCSIYYSLSDHSLSASDYARNSALLEAYRDSIIAMAESGSPDYWLNMAAKDYARGDYVASLADLDSLAACADNGADAGVMAYQRALSLEKTGDIEAAKYNYAVAAAHDLSQSVRKYEALQELARILSAEGDDKRAYRYIMRAISDIQASNARSRLGRIAGYLPIITAAYTDAQQVSGRNKTMMLVLAAVLIAALCVAVAYALRGNRRLAHERRVLHQKNEELENLRARLSDTNRLLQESAKVKEQYLGYLFNLCAEYIGSLEKYRLQMSQRIKAGKIKDVSSVLALPQGTDHL
ncbi:MAG: hypothetical protein K2O10_05035, partial [Muribaculaceae bacterium]|nr:hypothetical protein [Muribaculaceae bacterium]